MRLAAAVLGACLAAISGGVAVAQTPAPTCPGDITPAATVERATFQSRGRDIESLLFRPTGAPNGAGVVMLHGAGGLQADVPRLETGVAQLASRGYVVLLPSYYDVSGRTASEVVMRNPLARDHWKQVGNDAVRYLASLPEVADDRVGSWGFSQGGFLAVDGAVIGGPAKAVVAVAGAGSLSRGSVATPVLLIAADHDPVITITSVNAMADALRRRGAPVSMETLHTTRHLFDAPIWCEVFDHTRRFFDAQLLPTAN
ncbi:MAG: hypothetical protein EON90_09585 [Brevundimonas sp.]|nr:MAG: hypothetical protein EON90_09585 [Brevundimonas sp.]